MVQKCYNIFDTHLLNVAIYGGNPPFSMAVHARDNHGRQDEHLPIGSGNIDWKPLSKELNKCVPGCPVIFEIRKKYLSESKAMIARHIQLL